jgi:hypothetical protein
MTNSLNETQAQQASGTSRVRAFAVERPVLFGAAAVALTVAGARLINHAYPGTHVPIVPGVRVHHYVFGIFILTIAGYLALVFRGPRATFWIGLLYGFGVGLTFDEFGFWFNPPRAMMPRAARWEYTGIIVITSFFLLTALLRRLRARS